MSEPLKDVIARARNGQAVLPPHTSIIKVAHIEVSDLDRLLAAAEVGLTDAEKDALDFLADYVLDCSGTMILSVKTAEVLIATLRRLAGETP